MEDIEAVPSVLDDAERGCSLRRHGEHGRAVRSVERALPDDEHRHFFLRRRMVNELREAFRASAEIVVGICEVGLFANDADRTLPLR